MTYLEQSINLAIKNGFRPQDYGFTNKSQELYGNKFQIMGKNEVHIYTTSGQEFWVHTTQITSDPKFFQALGRGLGWPKETVEYHIDTQSWDDERRCLIDGYIERKVPTWRYHHHRLIDWIDDGKEIEEFFTNLLSNN
jgi:hypothetical protein